MVSVLRRSLVVVEMVTSGPNPLQDHIIDVAAINARTGEDIEYVAPLPTAMPHPDEHAETTVREISDLLAGNTLGSSDPVLAAGFLIHLFRKFDIASRWHPRMVDLAALTAGARQLPVTALPDLRAVAAILNIPAPASNSHGAALGDARLSLACFAAIYPSSSPATTTGS